jgi:hypothetical protein
MVRTGELSMYRYTLKSPGVKITKLATKFGSRFCKHGIGVRKSRRALSQRILTVSLYLCVFLRMYHIISDKAESVLFFRGLRQKAFSAVSTDPAHPDPTS